MEAALFAVGFVAWAASGVLAGEMLSYPGDGRPNFRHIIGAWLGPFALFLAVCERAFAD